MVPRLKVWQGRVVTSCSARRPKQCVLKRLGDSSRVAARHVGFVWSWDLVMTCSLEKRNSDCMADVEDVSHATSSSVAERYRDCPPHTARLTDAAARGSSKHRDGAACCTVERWLHRHHSSRSSSTSDLYMYGWMLQFDKKAAIASPLADMPEGPYDGEPMYGLGRAALHSATQLSTVMPEAAKAGGRKFTRLF
ncbi:hypothetical protein CDD80_777 [Ophiocordyceps camponoti-rufipedis]|uniref:Uncharacterized protein n=1 Tax=Ophiocordyceps camponoti-rufipedis TaxID=2004952 RepID=A0A2C5Z894_9HYPO|nr:hypothetical protein CDD80_777 [Ophiocordyceps camponoti-rufipedis]